MQSAQPAQPAEKKSVPYICGDCGVETYVPLGQPVSCKECGHKIMYKKRTSRVIQHLAR